MQTRTAPDFPAEPHTPVPSLSPPLRPRRNVRSRGASLRFLGVLAAFSRRMLSAETGTGTWLMRDALVIDRGVSRR